MNLSLFALFVAAARRTNGTLRESALRRGRRLSGAGLIIVAALIARTHLAAAT